MRRRTNCLQNVHATRHKLLEVSDPRICIDFHLGYLEEAHSRRSSSLQMLSIHSCCKIITGHQALHQTLVLRLCRSEAPEYFVTDSFLGCYQSRWLEAHLAVSWCSSLQPAGLYREIRHDRPSRLRPGNYWGYSWHSWLQPSFAVKLGLFLCS